jgi:xylulokinase
MVEGWFLGIDCSSQSVKVTVINEQLQLVYQSQLDFDSSLPHYKTHNGAICLENNAVVSPPLMWVEGLFTIFDQMKLAEFPFDKIKAVSASAQQHGSVYWKVDSPKALHDPELFKNKENLPRKAEELFSFPLSPIWRDSSTSEDCQRFLQCHSREWWRVTTGSPPCERFTAAQISKRIREDYHKYNETT